MPESRKRKPLRGKNGRSGGDPRRRSLPRRDPADPFVVLGEHDVAQLARPSCNRCGAEPIWMTLSEGAAGARLESQRAGAVGLMVEVGLPGNADFWCCSRCDNFGGFSPMTDDDVDLPDWLWPPQR